MHWSVALDALPGSARLVCVLDHWCNNCEKARKGLKDRQKVIRITNRSKYGWSTVSEYEEYELADGSDDEKYFYRAESQVSKKAKARRAAKRKKEQE